MAPVNCVELVSGRHIGTPPRRPDWYTELISISATNKLRFKPRSFKIPKYMSGLTGRRQRRNSRVSSPLLQSEEEYKIQFARSLPELNSSRSRSNSPCQLSNSSIQMSSSTDELENMENLPNEPTIETEVSITPVYSEEGDCENDTCWCPEASWSDSEDGDDEDEDENDAVAAGDLQASFDIQIPDLHNYLEILSIDDYSFSDHPNSDSMVDIYDMDTSMVMQMDNLNIRDEQPQETYLSYSNCYEQIDELILTLLPNETVESLLPEEDYY